MSRPALRPRRDQHQHMEYPKLNRLWVVKATLGGTGALLAALLIQLSRLDDSGRYNQYCAPSN